jgi:hypothetical protein
VHRNRPAQQGRVLDGNRIEPRRLIIQSADAPMLTDPSRGCSAHNAVGCTTRRQNHDSADDCVNTQTAHDRFKARAVPHGNRPSMASIHQSRCARSMRQT